MSNLIIPVATIEKLTPHTNADSLELAQVLGWQLVVRKGEYEVGSKIVYFPIDTVLPQELSDRFGVTNYLSKGRIRCAKLRNEPSFGLAVKPENDEWQVGQDVTEYYAALGVKKYEPPVRVTAGDAEPEHPLFVKYTEIENMRNFPDIFQEGEMVILTEKIHGCLSYQTRITMADNTCKVLKRVEQGEYVLGMDQNGKIVSTKVLKTFQNGSAEKWLTVTGKRRLAGRGNHYWAVHCTPNHKFWCSEEQDYVSAELLNPGDKVLLLRSEIGLTPLQEQVLIGKMLGDGSLHDTEQGAAVEWGHKAEHEEYIDWTLQALSDIAYQRKGERTSGYGTKMICASSTFNIYIKELFQDWISIDGIKKIPSWVAEKITPITLAFWYMDDGSLGHHEGQEDRAMFATCAFSSEDCEILIQGLHRLGINAQYYQSGHRGQAKIHSRLRLNADDAERLFLLIAPYIPPVMQYKLPERYRGHSGWIPASTNVYKPLLVEQTIDRVFENSAIKSSRYDLETETHNFFANGILVHNSNSRVGIIEGEFMAGSHGLRRMRPENFASSLYWYPLSLPPVREMLEDLATRYRQVILFGEIYGSKIQSLDYGHKGTMGYRAFDLLVDGKYLSCPAFMLLCAEHGVDTVPPITYIHFNLDAIKGYSQGNTLLMQDNAHIREGVVVKPMLERSDPKIGRCVLKYVSDQYLFAKKSDYTDQ